MKELDQEGIVEVGHLLDSATDALPYERRDDPSFWVEMLRHQVDEARGQVQDERNAISDRHKILNELVDVLGVAWSAIHSLSDQPKRIISERTQQIIGRSKEIRDKYEKLYGTPVNFSDKL